MLPLDARRDGSVRTFRVVQAIEVYWWRIVFHLLRLATWTKVRVGPLIAPVAIYMWLPVLALLLGLLLGIAIAVGKL